MTPQFQKLLMRLQEHPHDDDALSEAHQLGGADPHGYVELLERLGREASQPPTGAHWLSEAAEVWRRSLGAPERGAELLLEASEMDPVNDTVFRRLSAMYADGGDFGGLEALFARRVSLLEPRAAHPDAMDALRATFAQWAETLATHLNRRDDAMAVVGRWASLDAHNPVPIYQLRELLLGAGRSEEALQYFEPEAALVQADPDRVIALRVNEAELRASLGDVAGALVVLDGARALRPDDVQLWQAYGSMAVEGVRAGIRPRADQAVVGAQLLTALAETYGGEYGMAYATSALELAPGDDRAMQLAEHFARELGRLSELARYFDAYLRVNPAGYMASAARTALEAAPSPPPPSAAPAPAAPAGRERLDTVARAFEGVMVDPEPASPGMASPQGASAPYSPPASSAPLGASRPAPNVMAQARSLAEAGNKDGAWALVQEMLSGDPANAEALAWAEDHLRQSKAYPALRDLLLNAARAAGVSESSRKGKLKDVAALSEAQLKDLDGAIAAWKEICQVDRGDAAARDQLRRLLERTKRWDDLALMLEQDAMAGTDTESRLELEKRLANLHETKRKDPATAAEAWVRIATLLPGDIGVLEEAIRLFQAGNAAGAAARFLAEQLPLVTGLAGAEMGAWWQRLGELYGQAGEPADAGMAFQRAAELTGAGALWRKSEDAFRQAGNLMSVVAALDAQVAVCSDDREREVLLTRATADFQSLGDAVRLIQTLEARSRLGKLDDAAADLLDAAYLAQGMTDARLAFWQARAEEAPAGSARAALRRRVAALHSEAGDVDALRSLIANIVDSDGPDGDLVDWLLHDARTRNDTDALLRYLPVKTKQVTDPAEGTALQMELATLLEAKGDPAGACLALEAAMTLSPSDAVASRRRVALLVDDDPADLRIQVLSRHAALCQGEEELDTRRRLAGYLVEAGSREPAIAELEKIRALDPDDLDTVARLEPLYIAAERFTEAAEVLAVLLETEGEDDERSLLARKLATLLADKLGRGEDALKVLAEPAADGDAACQEAYVVLGDRLGDAGGVAGKLVEWSAGRDRDGQASALAGAMERFLTAGRRADARAVGLSLLAMTPTPSVIAVLEDLCVEAREISDWDLLSASILSGLDGPSRAREAVRLAKVRVSIGGEALETVTQAERALLDIEAPIAEGLLAELSALLPDPDEKIALYERQAHRAKEEAGRLGWSMRAVEVSCELRRGERAKSHLQAEIGKAATEEALDTLEGLLAGRHVDVTKAFVLALQDETTANRLGPRGRAMRLLRAARLTREQLGNNEGADALLVQSLACHVDDAGIAAVHQLCSADPEAGLAVIGRALGEVYDGPLVRRLLKERAELLLGAGRVALAAEDLKRLHDLSPGDVDTAAKLGGLYEDLGDSRGLIQLHEDQILRGRDAAKRLELARRVAMLWEERVGDAREAADAWRRVLRMKAGDEDATKGLERAKSGKLLGAHRRPAEPEPILTPPTGMDVRGAAPAVAHQGVTVPVVTPAGVHAARAADADVAHVLEREPEEPALVAPSAGDEDATATEVPEDLEMTATRLPPLDVTPPTGVAPEMFRMVDESTPLEPVPNVALDAMRESPAEPPGPVSLDGQEPTREGAPLSALLQEGIEPARPALPSGEELVVDLGEEDEVIEIAEEDGSVEEIDEAELLEDEETGRPGD